MTVIVRLGDTASGGVPLLAFTVKVNAPGIVGAPASAPLVESRLSPFGSEPDATLNVGDGLPVAAKVYEYGLPTLAVVAGLSAVKLGAAVTVTVNVGVIASGGVPLLALTANVNTPGVVGVPATTPLAESRLSPFGSEPDATLNVGGGLPVAAKV